MATSAHAQQWLGDRQRGTGRGVLVGTFELHPGIGAELGYDSNVFLSDDNEESSGVLRVAPSLYLSTLTGERLHGEEPKVSLRAGVSGTFKHYFATSLSDHPDMGVGEDAKFTWNASSIFALELFQDYKRTIDPFGEPGDATNAGINDFDRDQLGGGTRLQLSTPGKLLKGGLGYRIGWDSFENDDLDANDSLSHSINADTSWEFLPRTAVFWNGVFGIHDYLHEDAPGLGARADSKSISNKLGLNGALTPRVSFTLAGGYDAAFSDDQADSEAVTAQVEARWRVLVASQWTLGYDRTLRSAFQGNTMLIDRIKTGFSSMFGGVLALNAKVEFSFVDFGTDPVLGDRDDKHLVTSLGGEYRFVDWFAVTAEVGYLQNFTDFYVRTTSDVDADDDGELDVTQNFAKYKRFEAWLGVRAFL